MHPSFTDVLGLVRLLWNRSLETVTAEMIGLFVLTLISWNSSHSIQAKRTRP